MWTWVRRGSLLLALIALTCCAGAKIQKVPNRSDYANWTDDDQRRADEMDGLRFYRSRPYVAVSRPFPVRSRSYIVHGVTSPDGQFVRITSPLPAELRGQLDAAGVQADGMLPAALVFPAAQNDPVAAKRRAIEAEAARINAQANLERAIRTKPAPPPGPNAQGGAVNDTNKDALGGQQQQPRANPPADAGTTNPATQTQQQNAGTTTTAPLPDPSDPNRPQQEKDADESTGLSTLELSTDLDRIGSKDVNDFFDIIYLPDFEEEYVIDTVPGLGNSDVKLTQGPGGILLAAGVEVDNSQLNEPILKAWDALVGAATKAGVSAMGVPGEGIVAPDAQGGMTTMGPNGLPVFRDMQGTPISLRIHVVSMANPGLYPILKADELVDNRCLLRQLHERGVPGCNPVSCNGAVAEHVLPCFPYTRIAYQVHSKVIVEHLISTTNAVSVTFATGANAQGGQIPSGARAQGGAVPVAGNHITDAELVRRINGALADRCRYPCVCVEIVSRDPATGPVASIKRLAIRIRHRAGGQIHPTLVSHYESQAARAIKEAFGWGTGVEVAVAAAP